MAAGAALLEHGGPALQRQRVDPAAKQLGMLRRAAVLQQLLGNGLTHLGCQLLDVRPQGIHRLGRALATGGQGRQEHHG